MKYNLSVFSIYVVLFMLLGGCATTPVDPKDKTLSMVYGYMGASGSEGLFGPMKWATLKENSQPAVYHDLNITRSFWERGGLFWHMGLKSGSYQLDNYGHPDARFLYGTFSQNITSISITEPNVYYMGSYWHEGKNKIFSQSTFDIKRINKPTEREIVQRLIKEFESEGHNNVYVHQYNWLKKRLNQLPQ